MRNTFINTLVEMAEQDPDLWLLCGDLGFSVLETFAERFPERFVNVGIAEQNMIGIAAGLAQSGKNVFTYSIANFSFMRCLEQIRNDVCYHNNNVTSVAVGGGLVYGSLGYSHYAVEDLAIMRTLPNLTVMAPGDPAETVAATRHLAKHKGPAYLRLGRGGEAIIHKNQPESIDPSCWQEIHSGKDLAIISTGGILDICDEAVQTLKASGIDVSLHSIPIVKPFDNNKVVELAKYAKAIITVEEHSEGGLYSLVAESLVNTQTPCKLAKMRMESDPVTTSGSHTDLRNAYGLSAPKLVELARAVLA